jgi:hypothetical protein
MSNLNLYRTPNHMFSQYRGDGHGRDTYIFSKNGGIRKDPHPLNINEA